SADELSTLDKQRTTALLPMLSRIQTRNERRHAEIRALSVRGLPMSAIADQLRLNRTTVRKFVRVSSAAAIARVKGVPVRGAVTLRIRWRSFFSFRWRRIGWGEGARRPPKAE